MLRNVSTRMAAFFFAVTLSPVFANTQANPIPASKCEDALIRAAVETQVSAAVTALKGQSELSVETIEQLTRNLSLGIAQAKTNIYLQQFRQAQDQYIQASQALQECGGHSACRRSKLSKMASTLNLIRKIVHASLTSESVARQELALRISEVVDHWANYASGDEINQKEQILREGLKAEKFRFGKFFKKIFSQVGQTLGGIWSHFTESFTAINIRELRSRPAAMKEYKENLGTILGFQVAGQLANAVLPAVAGQQSLLSGLSQQMQNLWVYGNTAANVTLQSEVAARHTPEGLQNKILSVTDMDSALTALPEILHGKNGYVYESKAKLLAFVTLWPFELAVGTAFKMINLALQNGGEVFSESAQWSHALGANSHFLLTFGSYLVLRWSVLDKWLNLKMIPGYEQGTKEKFDLAWQEYQTRCQSDDTLPRDLELALKDSRNKNLKKAHDRMKLASRIKWSWKIGINFIDAWLVFWLVS